MLAAERDRWALWIPVLIGCGISAYFAAAAEPTPWPAAAAAAVAGACAVFVHGGLRWLTVAVLCAVVGFAAAAVRTQLAFCMASSPVG